MIIIVALVGVAVGVLNAALPKALGVAMALVLVAVWAGYAVLASRAGITGAEVATLGLLMLMGVVGFCSGAAGYALLRPHHQRAS